MSHLTEGEKMCDEYKIRIGPFGTMHIDPKDVIKSRSFKKTIDDIIKLFDKKQDNKREEE